MPFKQIGTSVEIDGSEIEIPNFHIEREIGSGANGTVYQARDLFLDRIVAVKVWNARGRNRAQMEAAKIGALSHPLVVTTHVFGSVNQHPYAVMEYIEGASAKEWIRETRTLQDRICVWRLYVQALRHFHSLGVVHGDPHLGNILVFDDAAGTYPAREFFGESAFAIKLTDAGTSEFWSDHTDFEKREAKLIRKTAQILFREEQFRKFEKDIHSLNFRQMIDACDAVVSVIQRLNSPYDSYAVGLLASAIVDHVIAVPVFDLDGLYEQVRACPGTNTGRVSTRIYSQLKGLRELDTSARTLTAEMREMYQERRVSWLVDR